MQSGEHMNATNAQKIKELTQSGFNQTEIAKMMGFTRQYINAVLAGYHRISPSLKERVKIRSGGKCEYPLHSENNSELRVYRTNSDDVFDTLTNLSMMCRNCYDQFRVALGMNKTKDYQCIDCGGTFKAKRMAVINKEKSRCLDCSFIFRQKRKEMWCWKHRLTACKNCGKSEKPHQSKGYCRGCYWNVRRKEPLNKARHRIYVERYNAKHYERLLIQRREYARKYYALHRKKLST